MAKVIPIGQPTNESERQAIRFLRDHLPEGWLIFHNFEMRQGEEVFEVDIASLRLTPFTWWMSKGRGAISMYMAPSGIPRGGSHSFPFGEASAPRQSAGSDCAGKSQGTAGAA